MNQNLILIVMMGGVIVAVIAAFVWLTIRLGPKKAEPKKDVTQGAAEDVEHIFNEEFRNEMRNRGRLYFEKIIGENAMFLQQDLRLTTSELNAYMKQEIAKKLQEEFFKYEQSINDAKQLAIESIDKTNKAVEEERQSLSSQVEKEFAFEKARLVRQFETNMATIVSHYVLAAIGNQLDLSDQLELILHDMEANKQAIIEDIIHAS